MRAAGQRRGKSQRHAGRAAHCHAHEIVTNTRIHEGHAARTMHNHHNNNNNNNNCATPAAWMSRKCSATIQMVAATGTGTGTTGTDSSHHK